MRSILLALAVGTLPAVASAQSTQIVHRFDVPPQGPRGGLVEAADGDLYGTTSMGGDGRGTLYRLPPGPGGVIEVVHRFSRGMFPDADLTRGRDGFLYGTTRYGGADNGGTVFRFDPATRALITLHVFTWSDGRGPQGPVLQASDGLLYGATEFGDGSRLYQLDPVTGRVRWFRIFTFEEGSVYRTRGLVEAPSGALYGVLWGNSSASAGTVYRLDRATGAITIVHAFLTGESGSGPIALTRTSDGLLYGVRAAGFASGAGRIFRVDPATDTVTEVYALNPASDGVDPVSPLVEASDGSLYGTTAGPNGGTVFRLERLAGGGHVFTIVRALSASFTGTDPTARLALASDGWLYGATASGGLLGGGALVRLDGLLRGAPGDPWQSQVLSSFSIHGDGWRPIGPPITGSDGALYGVTAAGGDNGQGTVYRLEPQTGSFGRVGSLPADDSTGSHSGLVDGGDGSLYAVAGGGSFGAVPRIMKVTPATSTVAVIHTFFGQPEIRRVHPVLVHGPAGFFGLLENGSGLVAYRFDPAAMTTTVVSAPLSAGVTFGSEVKLLAASDGLLYASDASVYSGRPPTFIGHVYRIDPGSGTTTLLASTIDGFSPAALARAPDGRVFIGGSFDATGPRLRSVDPASGLARLLCAPPASAFTDIEVMQDGSLLVAALTATGPVLYRCSGTTPDFARVEAWPADVRSVSIGLAADGLFYGATVDPTPFAGPAFAGSGIIFRLVGEGPPGTMPIIDRDGDTLSDDWERAYGLDETAGTGGDGADGDPDGDGLRNVTEQAFGQHPRGFFVRYFAEGSTNAFFATQFALGNPGLDPAHVLVRFQTDDGRTVRHPLLLPPRSRHTIDVAQLDGLATATFSAIVESDLPLTADRTMTWGAGGYGSHADSGVAAPSATWYFAEGSTSGDFALFYLLQNPQAQAVLATVRFLRPFGLPPLERQYVLQPGSRTTLAVDSVDPALASTDVSAVITATAPIIAERAMYLSRPGQPFAAGHASAGVTAPALTWFVAEGATGAFFDLFLLLANPGAQPAAVTVDYLLPRGEVLTKAYTVPADSRRTIWVDDEQVPAGSGSKPLANAALSMIVRSTNGVPVIVERTMWWPGPAISPTFWYEAHNSPGSTTTARRWALAGGDVGGTDGQETYVLIANTSAIAGRVLVRLLFENGNTTGRYYDVLPASRTNVPVSVDFPEAVPEGRFAVIVEDVSASPLALAVEYASYASPDGVVWARGSSALATPLP